MSNLLTKDIISEWGIGSLPADQQEDIIERIGRMIYQAVLVKALDILSEKEQVEFDLLLDEDNTTPNEVLAFLKLKIPTFDILVQEERQNLKQDLLVKTT